MENRLPIRLPLQWLRKETGQNLVELALVMPVLLLFLAGIFDFGRGMQVYVVMVNAAREAAMAGADAQLSGAQLQGLVVDELNRGGLNGSQTVVTVNYQGAPPQSDIVVSVQYELPLLLAVLSIPNVTLNTSAQMAVFWGT